VGRSRYAGRWSCFDSGNSTASRAVKTSKAFAIVRPTAPDDLRIQANKITAETEKKHKQAHAERLDTPTETRPPQRAETIQHGPECSESFVFGGRLSSRSVM